MAQKDMATATSLPTAPLSLYRVKTDQWLYGIYRKTDDLVELTDKQAKYALMDDLIELIGTEA